MAENQATEMGIRTKTYQLKLEMYDRHLHGESATDLYIELTGRALAAENDWGKGKVLEIVRCIMQEHTREEQIYGKQRMIPSLLLPPKIKKPLYSTPESDRFLF